MPIDHTVCACPSCSANEPNGQGGTRLSGSPGLRAHPPRHAVGGGFCLGSQGGASVSCPPGCLLRTPGF